MRIPKSKSDRKAELLEQGLYFVCCGGKSAPDPPDYEAAAEATAAGNLEALQMQTETNRPTQITPFGSTVWSQDPDNPNAWTQTTELAPDSQRALASQLRLMGDRSQLGESLMGRAEQEFGTPMDWGALPDYAQTPQGQAMAPGMVTPGSIPDVNINPGDIRNRAEDALYSRATSRLDPQWEQREQNMHAQLVARGHRPGDPAYRQAMENMGRERTDAYDRAMTSAIAGGGAEASRQFGMERDTYGLRRGKAMDEFGMGRSAALDNFGMGRSAVQDQYGMDMASAGYQNQMRQAQLAEEMQRRGFSLNEINAIISGQQVGMPDMPSFSMAGRTQGPDYMGAANATYGANINNYNAEQMALQGLMSGVGNLAFAF